MAQTPQSQIVKERNNLAFRIYGSAPDRKPSRGSFDQRPLAGFGFRCVVRPRDGSQELRKSEHAQLRCSLGCLINRKSFIEPIVITLERQRIWHPQMKKLMRHRRAQLRQCSNLGRQLSHQQSNCRSSCLGAPLAGTNSLRKWKQNEACLTRGHSLEHFAMRFQDFAGKLKCFTIGKSSLTICHQIEQHTRFAYLRSAELRSNCKDRLARITHLEFVLTFCDLTRINAPLLWERKSDDCVRAVAVTAKRKRQEICQHQETAIVVDPRDHR